jgi:DNA-binding LacI/PurR family transcriptional regulator
VVEVNTNNRRGPRSITFDDEGAGADAAWRFAERGFRRPAYLTGAGAEHYSIGARWEGLADGARRRGLEAPVRLRLAGSILDPHRNERTVIELAELLRRNATVDCVLLHADLFAPTLYAAAERAGRRIGEDLGVVGFNDSLAGWALSPQLTVFHVNTVALARRMFDTIEAFEKGRGPEAAQTVQWELIGRGSG